MHPFELLSFSVFLGVLIAALYLFSEKQKCAVQEKSVCTFVEHFSFATCLHIVGVQSYNLTVYLFAVL